MKIDGQCLCGDVTWQAEVNPELVGICHCTQCQTNGASAFQWIAQVSAEHFQLLTGELKSFIKTSDSGNQRALSFCPNCGTTIHGGNVNQPQMYSLRLGGCRQRDQLEPKSQLWHRSAMTWASDLPAGQILETQPTGPK